MMSKAAQYYRELVSPLSERLRHGECDIDVLVIQVWEKVVRAGDLTQNEIESAITVAKRDLEGFVRSYEESHEDESDSVFIRVIEESLRQELVGVTDKTQLEWRGVFQDLNHHGVYHSGEVVGLRNLVYEKCHHHLAVYTPDALPHCPKCSHDQFQRRPFEP